MITLKNSTISPDQLDITAFSSVASIIHPLILQIIYIAIITVGFIANFLICSLLTLNQSLMNKFPSCRFIFLLAVVDALTVILVLVSPSFEILGSSYPYPRGNISGPVFCAFIGSDFFIWGFGFVSVYTITSLSIERMSSVVWPNVHHSLFRTYRMYYIMILVFIIGLALSIPNILHVRYFHDQTIPCICLPLTDIVFTNTVIYFTLIALQFIIPFTITFISYVTFAYQIRKTKFSSPSNQYAVNMGRNSIRNKQVISAGCLSNNATSPTLETWRRQTKRISIISIMITLAFFICWFPNQLIYTLVQLQIFKSKNPWLNIRAVLVISSSTINPVIYVVIDPNFRKLFWDTLKQITYKLPGR
ncbi:Rhodopsin, GQ-coupled [Trichoplax sp. H2]|nr:Rhodopsin, GQ-coupled [Trichoplax sp. H2]|eukprot:RDD43164.1 Rhodopsin, GQ-coupled [Trichoplax sp. H2]